MVSALDIVVAFVVLIVVLLVAGYVISIYNQLVRLKKRVDQADKNIGVLLKQRQDELTKLIDAAKEYMDHERELLTQLTEAREQAERAKTPTEHANADNQVKQALSAFSARFEDYPDLRSQSNMLQFQERISEIESQIADRREFYNDAVTQYNTRIAQFPYVLFARQMGFKARELFTVSEEEKEDVDVGEAFATA